MGLLSFLKPVTVILTVDVAKVCAGDVLVVRLPKLSPSHARATADAVGEVAKGLGCAAALVCSEGGPTWEIKRSAGGTQ